MIEERTWIRGIAQPLPAGESLLWSGAPNRAALARHALHVRIVVGYFVLLILIGLAGAAQAGVPFQQMAAAALTQGLLAGLVIGGVYAYAALTARHTVYAITDRRVVMRVGLVLPTTINIPFRLIESAASRVFPDGTGQIALAIQPPDRIGFLHLWPHVRPWRLRHPEPVLRGLTDPAHVTTIIRAIALESGTAEVSSSAPPRAEMTVAPRTLRASSTFASHHKVAT